jgi:hypothetical protein
MEFTPRINLIVEYPHDVLVHRGNHLTPTQTRDQPIVTYRVAVPRWWSLMMLDLDVPTPYEPIARACVHWLMYIHTHTHHILSLSLDSFKEKKSISLKLM